MRTPPVALAVSATACVQVGAAISVHLFGTFGVLGTTWLRLLLAALVLLAVGRPTALARADVAAACCLGVVIAANSVLFALASDGVALGVVVAVEFCGPLSVAAAGHGGRLGWPAAALAGVLVLTRPWDVGAVDGREWIGIALAAGAGCGWAAYILLTAHLGGRTDGLAPLAVALATAALVLAPFGARSAWVGLPDHRALLTVALAAAFVPLGSFALELAALRQMPAAVFGVWMAVEPAMGAVAGWVILDQGLSAWRWPGVALVVGAGVATHRGARRSARTIALAEGSV